jgi:hypothetical protein
MCLEEGDLYVVSVEPTAQLQYLHDVRHLILNCVSRDFKSGHTGQAIIRPKVLISNHQLPGPCLLELILELFDVILQRNEWSVSDVCAGPVDAQRMSVQHLDNFVRLLRY